jgi:hypothetical protein
MFRDAMWKIYRAADHQHGTVLCRTVCYRTVPVGTVPVNLFYKIKNSNIPALVVLFSGCCPLGLHGFSVDGVGAGRLNTT